MAPVLPAAPPGLVSRCTFPAPGAPIACAVSGGADSMALMALAVEAGCAVTAFHVDHGLREGSAGEAAVVSGAASRLGASFRSLRAVVEPGPNLEARAREARFGALPGEVATGHTADDQAETVLLNLLRGAGVEGMAGMRRGPRHPILGIRRADAAEVCRRLDLRVVEDPSNSDRSYLRNRVRHELLPLMSEMSERDVVPVLARQAELMADDADLLAGLARAVDPVDAAALREAPLPLSRRAVRSWIKGPGSHPPAAAEVERVLEVARLAARACEVGGGARVSRSGGRMRIDRRVGQPGRRR